MYFIVFKIKPRVRDIRVEDLVDRIRLHAGVAEPVVTAVR
jgi:hypothetical protein